MTWLLDACGHVSAYAVLAAYAINWYGRADALLVHCSHTLKTPCLAGTLPEAWAAMTEMNTLKLPNNSISGPLPQQWGIGALPKLQQLNLSLNHVREPICVMR